MTTGYKEHWDTGRLVWVERLNDEGVTCCIPPDENNGDFREYNEWLAKGNAKQVVDDTWIPTVEEKRRMEYDKQGCNDHDLLVALWEKIVEGRPEVADEMQAKRQAIKTDIPKE